MNFVTMPNAADQPAAPKTTPPPRPPPPRCLPGRQASPSPSLNSLPTRPSSASSRSSGRSQHRRHSSSPFEPRRNGVQNRGRPEITIVSAQPMANHPAFADGNKGGYIPPEAPPSYEQAMRSPAPRNPTFTDPTVPDHISEVRRVFPEVTLAISHDNRVSTHRNHSPLLTSQTIHHNTTVTSSNSTTSSRPRCNNSATSSEVFVAQRARLRNLNHSNNQQIQRTTVQSGAVTPPEQSTPSTSQPPTTSSSSSSSLSGAVPCNSTKPRRPAVPPKDPSLVKLLNSNNNNTVKGPTPSSEQSSQQPAGTSSQENTNNELSTVTTDTSTTTEPMDSSSDTQAGKHQNANILTLFDTNIPPPSGTIPLPTPLQPNSATPHSVNVNSSPGGVGNNGTTKISSPIQPATSPLGGAVNKGENAHSREMATPLVLSVPNPVPSKASHPKKVPPPRPSFGPRKSCGGNTAPMNTNPFVCENDFSDSGYESIKYPDNKPLGGAIIKTASPSLGGVLSPTKVSSPSTASDDVFMNAGYASISNSQANPTLGGMLRQDGNTNPFNQPPLCPDDPLDSDYASIMYPQGGAENNSPLADILTPTKATSLVIQRPLSLSDPLDPGYASINYPLGVQNNIGASSTKAPSGEVAFSPPGGLLTPTKVANVQSRTNDATLASQPSPGNSPLAGVLTPTKANKPAVVAKSPPGGQTSPNLALLGDASKPVNSQNPPTPTPVPRRNKSVVGKANTQAVAEPVYAAVAKKRASKADSMVEGQPTDVHLAISNSSPPPPVPTIRPPLEDFEDLFSTDEMNIALEEREKNQDRLTDAKQTEIVETSPGYASISTPGNSILDDLLGFGALAPSTDTSSKASTTGSIGESTEEKIEPVYESRSVKNTQQDNSAAGGKLPHVVHSSRPPILPPPRSKKSGKDKSSDKKAEKKVRPPLPKNRPTHTEELAGTSKPDQKDLKSTEDNGEPKVTRKHSDGSKFAKNLKRRSMKLKNSMKIFKQKSLDDGKKVPEQIPNTESKEEPPPKPGSKPQKPAVPPPPRPGALPTTKLPNTQTSTTFLSPTTPTLAKAKPIKPPPPKKGPTRRPPAPPRRESNPSNDLLTLDPIQVKSSVSVTVEEETQTAEVTNTNNSNIFLLTTQILQPQPTPKPRSGSKNEGTTGPTHPVIANSKIKGPHRPPPARPNVKPSFKPKRPPPAVPPSKKVQSNYDQVDSSRKPQLGKEVSLGIHHRTNTSNEVSTPDGSSVLTPSDAAKPSQNAIGDTPDGKISTEKRQVVVALFDFTASADDELSFKAKEMITILAEENEDWFKGQIDDRQGIFPKKYVTIFENPSSPSASTESESVLAAVEISWDSEPDILPVGPEDAKKNQNAIKDDFSTLPPMSLGIINEPRTLQHQEDAAKKMDASEDVQDDFFKQPAMSPDISSEPSTLQLPSGEEMVAEKKQDASKDLRDDFVTQPAMPSSIINEPWTPQLPADEAKNSEETDAIEDGFSTQIAMSSGIGSEPRTLQHPEDVTKQDQDESVTVSSLDPVDFCNATSFSEPPNNEIVPADRTDDKTVMLRRSSTALFAFEGQDETELTFAGGDVITVTGKVNEEWLTGEVNGKSGIFPSNYIEETAESTEQSTTSDTSATNNLSHGANDDTVAPSSGGFVEPMATAIKDYTAPSSDEISFKMNDTLYLLEKFGSEWFMAQNDRSGSVGKVPVSHVKVIHPLPEGGSSMSWIM